MFFHQLWSKELKDPSGTRGIQKPRHTGLTLVIDKGIGLDSFCDLLQLHAGYIDYIKLSSISAALYPPSILKKKSEAAILCQTELYTDSQLIEVAIAHQQLRRFFDSLHQLEIFTIEIPEVSNLLSDKARIELIHEAKKEGFNTITLCQTEANSLSTGAIDAIQKRFELDKAAGATYVSLSQYPGLWLLEVMKDKLPLPEFIFPASQAAEQTALIDMYGNHMNISHVPFEDALTLETYRRNAKKKQTEWKISNES